MNRIKNILKGNWGLIVATLASVLLILLWYASSGDKEMYILFSSDALTLPSIYEDIFVNGNTFRGWSFNEASNFIPDMLLFFILMGITSNFLTSSLLFSLIQYLAIIYLFYVIFKKISTIRASVFALAIYLFSFFLLYFLVDNDYYYSYLVMSNSYHNGAFFMALVSIWLSIKFIKKDSWITLIFLFLLCAIAYPCDKLFLIAYICPALFTGIVLLIARGNWKKICKFGAACILGLLVGMVILDKFKHNDVFQITRMHQNIELDMITNSWNVFLLQMKTYLSEISFKSLTIILSIVSFIWTAYYGICQFIQIVQKKQNISLFFAFEIFVLFFVPMLILAPVLNGNYFGFDCIRYNYFIFIVLLFNLILLSNKFLEKHRHLTTGLNILFATALSTFLAWNIYKIDFIPQLKNVPNTYTERARSVDTLFPETETTVYGITDNYWYAKHVTMFSQNNIKLRVTFTDAIPYLLLTNRQWYTGGGDGKHADLQFTFLFWNSDLPLPEFFTTQNPPYETRILDNGMTLYLVKPFIFDAQTMQSRLL